MPGGSQGPPEGHLAYLLRGIMVAFVRELFTILLHAYTFEAQRAPVDETLNRRSRRRIRAGESEEEEEAREDIPLTETE